mmetsp:Transcript_23657/g.55153  ORF Transcript_23657/g.55153 Transcript_23657/m.55153 type:complete len:457 (-) Transcript_23657:127-1497(-)
MEGVAVVHEAVAMEVEDAEGCGEEQAIAAGPECTMDAVQQGIEQYGAEPERDEAGQAPPPPPPPPPPAQKEATGLEENRTLWVGDIELWMTERFLSEAFSQVRPVAGVKILRDRRNRNNPGYAFIDFQTHQDAEVVFDVGRVAGTVHVSGHSFRVNWAMYHTGCSTAVNAGTTPVSIDASVWVGNLDLEVTDVELFHMFSSRYDTVIGARIIFDQSGTSKGYGFVRFSDVSHASKSITEMDGAFVRKRPMKVKTAVHPGSTTGSATQSSTTLARTASVLGVDGTTTETELARLFAYFGPVAGVRISRDLRKASVEFSSPASTEAVANSVRGHRTSYAQIEVWWQDVVRTFALAGGQLTLSASSASSFIQHCQWTKQVEAAANTPGLNHFKTLLQDPKFVEAFHQQLHLRALASHSKDTEDHADSTRNHYTMESCSKPRLVCQRKRINFDTLLHVPN